MTRITIVDYTSITLNPLILPSEFRGLIPGINCCSSNIKNNTFFCILVFEIIEQMALFN